jgi:N-acyl-D-amino-acid deacylase
VAGPVSAPQLASYALTLALDAAPGAHYAYSNLGYVVLGRILEQASSLPYAEQVRRSVCAPAGMAAMSIAGTRPADRVAGEAVYYDSASAPLMTSVLPGEGQVPRPYGWTHLAAIDAAGGWMGSAVDLARFVTALDGSRGGPLLAAPWLDEMMARPDLPEWAGAASWFGLGMQVQPTSAGPIWHHGGSMPGTSAELLRAPGGWAIALLFNTRPDDAEVGRFEQELVDLAWTMASAPAPASPDDLFPLFP